MTLSEIKKIVRETLDKHGEGQIFPLLIIQWNNRLTSTLGRYSHYERKLDFSNKLYSRATYEEKLENVVHETCHVIQRFRYPLSSPHGREWKLLMVKSGFKPNRCHSVSNYGLSKRKQYKVYCGCTTHLVGKARFGRIQSGILYQCRKCKGNVNV
jgi:predicted SprT family Zn-dependent metalloprotease